MIAGGAVDQPRIDAHAAPFLPHRAFEDVVHVEIMGQLAHVGLPSLERLHAVARGDEQRRHLREVGDDVLGQSVGEVFLLGIAGDVDEGQHGDGRAVAGGIRMMLQGQPLGQRLEARVAAQGIEVGVMGQPFRQPAAEIRRRGEGAFQMGDGGIGIAEHHLGAGDIVLHEMIVGPDHDRAGGPVLRLLRLPHLRQRDGAEGQRAGIVGMQLDGGFHALEAAAGRGHGLIPIADNLVGSRQEAEGAIVIGPQLGGALEQGHGLLALTLHLADFAPEEAGFEQVRDSVQGPAGRRERRPCGVRCH